jgi:hypothetical protein
MNNATAPPFISVPQELFGGLYTEAAPESLPQGASPLCVNCDFIIGELDPRPGKESVYYYDGEFIERIAGFADSMPDPGSTGEAPWNAPSNATLGIPGTYAEVILNFAGAPPGSAASFDNAVVANGAGTPAGFSGAPNNTQLPYEWALFAITHGNTITSIGPGAWTSISNSSAADIYGQLIPGGALTVSASGTFGGGGSSYSSILATFYTENNAAPTIQNSNNVSDGFIFTTAPRTISSTWPNPNTAGNTILVVVSMLGPVGSYTSFSATDDQGDGFVLISHAFIPDDSRAIQLWIAEDIKGGANQVHITDLGGFASSGAIWFAEFSPFGVPTPSGTKSEELQGLNFGFSIPSTQQVLGFQIEAFGNQSDATATSGLIASLAVPGSPPLTIFEQLPASDGEIVFGTPISNWGLAPLTNNTIDNPNFTVQVQAVAPGGIKTIFNVYALKLKVWLTPNPAPSINYLKTFTETGGEVLNLFLGSNGTMYQEDAINNPGVLEAVDTEILPGSFAQSCTLDDREFIAVSNLSNGTDIPLTYTPPNFDRLSQVGPGAGPTVTTSSSTSAISVVSITQAAPTEIRRIAWGASSNAINNSTAGNVLVIFGEGRTTPLSLTLPNAVVGGTIVLSGLPPLFPKKGGGNIPYNLNGTYTIIQVTTAIVGGNETCPVFTVQAPATAYGYSDDFGSGGTPTSGWFYQATLATLTTNTQIPGLEIGGTLELTGTGGGPPGGYDGSWSVIGSPNASTMDVTATVLNNNVATYSYTPVGLSPNPTLGQLVTVTGTTNGNGIFNVTNQAITAVSPGTFSVGLTSATNISSAGETGSAQVFGTIFTFEPGQLVGTRNTGTVVQQGQLTAGVRKVCYSFLTRNGYITRPSPITTITVPQGAGALVVSGLAIGPSNVIARIIHSTATNGANFYNIPQDVTVTSNGQPQLNTSTWVNDNIATQKTLNFSDAVLLAADQIDIEGNNLFALEELGACVALIPYSQRLFAVGEQNKVQNLLNYSFDGGYGGNPGALYPLGWLQDPTFGAGGNVATSPIFGFNYQIVNTSGSTQATYGMITQGAALDEFKTPIIAASTTYSVRVTCAVPTGAASGSLVVDLYSPSAAMALGTFTLALNTIATSELIYTGTLLTTSLAPVPTDLQARLYATSIPNGVTINIDRIEVFPTEQPNNNLQVIGSYQNNFESFDLITGVILGTNVNQQPILSAFVLFDSLYLVKTGTIVNVSDNNTTEPNNWNLPRMVSPTVGTTGPYAVTIGVDEPDSGEEYAVIAGRPGAFLYAGGQPIKISEEIQSLWNTIYWKYGQTIWIQNDITNRRLLFGVPMSTQVMVKNKLVQNPWLPQGYVADNLTPTTPNVILECNYRQINTANELGSSPEVHRSYSGKLIASEIVRKWSIWTIKAPAAAFISRADKTAPGFLGNSDFNGKIFNLIEGLLQDDGFAFTQDYITSAFVSTETGQNTQMGNVRYNYDYLTLLIDGLGDLAITTLPNSLDTPYANQLLPDLTLPASTNGDVEVPVNECASRLFLRFTSSQINSGYYLKRAMVVMHQDPWSPVRGVNN